MLALLAFGAPVALAASGPGGAEVPGQPVVSSIACPLQPANSCAAGQQMTISGNNLQSVQQVTFVGASGGRDNVVVKLSPRAAQPTEISVSVPARAKSGAVRVSGSIGTAVTAPEAVKIVAGLPATDDASGSKKLIAGGKREAHFSYRVTGAAAAGAKVEAVSGITGKVVRSWSLVKSGEGSVSWDGFVGKVPAKSGTYVLRLNDSASASAKATAGSDTQFELAEGFFPIRGPHTLSSSAMQMFGGGRGHQGTDHFAKCGTPLAAWTSGVVQFNAFQGAAGNYIVVQRPNGESYAYMHMQQRSPVKLGAKVFAGERLGHLGDTGDAQGCHLHIELWTAPGWYKGGKPYDSLPLMKQLDKLN
ncbi:MAG: M23 family metallopeptidase [Solirubrobacterales bacterium]|nr:M23 family metallopeptidase [Solirubrobacterales bacterium]